MIVYRIEREKYLTNTLSGVGAALSEGFRWNSLNTRLVYTAESRALAILEVAMHLDLSVDLPSDRFIVEIEIPESLQILTLSTNDLPKRWHQKPPILETQYIGDDFVISSAAAVLKVPSAIVPGEFNYLINPGHPVAKKIRVLSSYSFQFDQRLKQK